MQKPVQEYMGIGIVLLLFSVLLTIIVFLTSVSRYFLHDGVEREALKRELAQQRELYTYNDKVMFGDDVLIAVKKYSKVTDMRIELSGSGSGIFYYLNESDPSSVWDLDVVRQQMAQNVYSKYLANLDRDFSGVVYRVSFLRVD